MLKCFISVILILSLCEACEGQHVTIRAPDGAYACGFRTKAGLITVAHLEGVGGVWVNREFDCRLIKNNSGRLHEVGEGVPSYFLCRRGRRHSLTIVRTERTQWVCSKEFFPGESGLPVFGTKGQVVGFVLGNYVARPYKGRVSRIMEIPEFRRSQNLGKKKTENSQVVVGIDVTDE